MTPERLRQIRAMYPDGTHISELVEEVERLHIELAVMKKHLDLALPQAAQACQIEAELEQAKSWRTCQTHGDINGATQWGCPDCVAQLRKEVEQAKEHIRIALQHVDGADYRIGHMRDNATPDQLREIVLGLAMQLQEAKERERQVLESRQFAQRQYDEQSAEHAKTWRLMKELESANARLREALTKAAWWFGGSGDGGPSVKDVISAIEAALIVPPTLPDDDEHEAWLDGKARVAPKEKP